MRITSFIPAAGPPMAGIPDKELSGIGTFAYTGSPVGTLAVVLAAN